MARHTGAVTTVKFSPSGRFLATGSDDKVVLIWEKDEEFVERPKAMGESEPDLEHWTVRKRLVAHDNDVQDIAWSPDSSMLVTVGLDRSIIIWNGFTFEKIKRFDVHNSHVKGVVFDPANKYFATASDDRSVLIFRYHKAIATNDVTFSIEHRITDPFRGSPLTSYFRRLSWSPDGQHIAVPNATNGPVSSVAIINRGDWNSEISLIGHSAPCEVTAFSPRLYELPGSKEVKGKKPKICSVIATAGQDKTLAIWKTNNDRPLLVANEICLKTITDMAWSADGRMLFVSCLDGTITAIFFDANELGKEVPLEKNESYLYRYGGDRESLIFPESVEQLELEDKAKIKKLPVVENRMDSLMKGTPVPKVESKTVSNSPRAKVTKVTTLKPQKKVQQRVKVTKDGKKRVAPTLMTVSAPRASDTVALPSNNEVVVRQQNKAKKSLLSSSLYSVPKLGVKSFVSGIRETQFEPYENGSVEDGEAELLKINQAGTNDNKSKKVSGKKRKEIDYPDYLMNLVNESLQETSLKVYAAHTSRIRGVLVILSSSYLPQYSLHIQNNFEYDKNSDIDKEFDQLPTRLLCVTLHKEKVFETFLPHSIVNGMGNDALKLWILVGAQGSIFLVSFSGRLVLPRIDLGGNICVLRNHGKYLLAITNTGLMYLWDIELFKYIVNKVSLAPLLVRPYIVDTQADTTISNSLKITSCEINTTGTPIFTVSNGSLYGWSSNLYCWIDISSVPMPKLAGLTI